MSDEIRLYVYHLDEDDPRKCSAKKMQRFGLATVVTQLRRLPRGALVLHPFAEKSVSFEDKDIAKSRGIIAVDCSWKHAEAVFRRLEKLGEPRALPFLIAVNPVNFGKPFQLTTLEAFVASLYILGENNQADALLKLYKWSPHFLEINKQPLEEYQQARNSQEIIRVQEKYL